jgi:P4 family phage/plasmid primase-like protien
MQQANRKLPDGTTALIAESLGRRKSNGIDLDALTEAALDSDDPMALLEAAAKGYGGSAPPDTPASRPRTDLGNAERLVERHSNDLRHCPPLGGWLAWDGKRWQKDDSKQVRHWAHETVRSIYHEASLRADRQEREELATWAKQSESKPRIEYMISIAEAHLYAAPDEFDAKPWLLNVGNGTVDLRTGELRGHRREDMLTTVAPTTHDPDAPAPTWEKFLARVIPDAETRAFLQRAVGYSLTGETGEECLFLPYGSGRNGKSKFLGALQDMLGRDYAQQMPAHTLMLKRSVGGASPELADLKGVRFAATSETSEGGRLDEAMVKQVTGGDLIRARQLNQPYVEFAPTHKLWLATNHKPQVRGTDEGIWSRIRLIPFEVFIPLPERDPRLASKLRAEASGILAWAVKGCISWQASGLGSSAAVEQATEEYRATMDWLGGFLEDRCDVGDGLEDVMAALYTDYVDWAHLNGEYVVTQRKFGDALAERGFAPRRGTAGQRMRVGLRLANVHLDRGHSDPSPPTAGSKTAGQSPSVTQVTQSDAVPNENPHVPSAREFIGRSVTKRHSSLSQGHSEEKSAASAAPSEKNGETPVSLSGQGVRAVSGDAGRYETWQGSRVWQCAACGHETEAFTDMTGLPHPGCPQGGRFGASAREDALPRTHRQRYVPLSTGLTMTILQARREIGLAAA